MNESRHPLQEYFDECPSPGATPRLEAWLSEDTARVRHFAELLALEQELRDAMASAKHRNPPTPLAGASSGPSVEQPAGVAWKRRRASRLQASWTARVAYAGLAASVLLAIGLASLSLNHISQARKSLAAESSQIQAELSPTVACLGRATGCRWNAGPPAEGHLLSPGDRLSLDAGVAEVIFENGALVSLQGPCDLSIDGPATCSLRVGAASVRAPETAFGFKVITPSGIVIDLGTEFGVSVDDLGGSEVHVFEGEVAFQAIDEAGAFRSKAIRLTESHACRYTLGGTSLSEFEANEASFHWRNRAPVPESKLPPMPVRRDLNLWLCSDIGVEVDNQGRVERWRDLAVGGAEAAEDALQLRPDHRPVLAPAGMNGRPAIRFGAPQTFLVTPPINTTNEQTAVVLFTLRSDLPKFQSLLNYNGPPQRISGAYGFRVNPAVFEICLRDVDKDNAFGVSGELFGGYPVDAPKTPDNLLRSFVMARNALRVDKPCVVAYRYSFEQQRMSLFLNSIHSETTEASMPIAIASRKIIGCHPFFEEENGVFHGDISELMLFNRALEDDEVHRVSDYLLDRYGLSD